MKALIWVSTIFIIELLNTLQSYATGFRVGYLITIALDWYIASTLCKKWEEHKISNVAKEHGMPSFEYIRSEVPQEVLEQCEEVRGDENLLKFVLKEYEKKGLVSGAYADIILQEYMRVEKKISSTNLYKCEMCDCNCDKVTYATITDDMGTRYRNLCDSCMQEHNAVPNRKKKNG